MIPLVAPGPGCALQVEHTHVERLADGWRETTRLEVAASPGCPWVDVILPANATLELSEGRTRLGDGRSRRLDPERFERIPRDLAGQGALRVHLPELIQGDRAILEVTRRWTEGFAWAPALHGARFAQLTGAPDDVVGFGRDGEAWWSAPPLDDAAARFGSPPLTVALPLAAPERIETALTLQIPGGNPQLTLYPGGGSTVRVEQALVFAADLGDRGWVVPLPTGAVDVAWSVRPERAALIVRHEDSLRVEIAGSEGGATVSLAWTAPDAPTFGEGDAALRVTAGAGEVKWESQGERRMWWLTSWQGARILPDRATFVSALDRRFANVNLPGVGLPTDLRGRTADAVFAEDALATFRDRYGIGRWPHDPIWPRKLIRARRGLAFTELEAALVLESWLEQGGLRADWALVRPLAEGPPGLVSPAGFVRPLVVVHLPDGPSWMDPGCVECGPWEIHPDAAGAALGPSGLEPPLPLGSWEVRLDAGEVSWQVEGAAALVLREWIASVPPDSRESRLAARLGAAALGAVEGVAEAGQPIRLVGMAGAPPEDPIESRDLGWTGTRRFHRPAQGSAPDLTWEASGLRWSRETVAGITTETLEVAERVVPAEAWDMLDAIRQGQPSPGVNDKTAPTGVPDPGLVIP